MVKKAPTILHLSSGGGLAVGFAPSVLRHGNAACVRVHIREHENALLQKYLFRFRGYRSVRAFDYNLRLDVRGVIYRNLIFERRRDQKIDIGFKQLFVCNVTDVVDGVVL